MPRSCIKILNTVFEIPRSASNSHSQLLIFVDCSPYTFNILRCSACCSPSGTRITFNGFSTIFEAFVPHFYLHCTHCGIHESLLNYPNSFRGRMFKLITKFDADLLLYSLSRLECNSHTVHLPTQWALPPSLTSIVKCHCSRMHISVHSPWLPGYIDVTQTVLVILTMAGLFLDRPCTLGNCQVYRVAKEWIRGLRREVCMGRSGSVSTGRRGRAVADRRRQDTCRDNAMDEHKAGLAVIHTAERTWMLGG